MLIIFNGGFIQSPKWKPISVLVVNFMLISFVDLGGGKSVRLCDFVPLCNPMVELAEEKR
jgi:hypothetical protein